MSHEHKPPQGSEVTRANRWPYFAVLAVGALVGAGLIWTTNPPGQIKAETRPEQQSKTPIADEAAASDTTTESDAITLPKESWSAAGLEVAHPSSAMFQETVRVTGRITLNEDRVAHVFPLVTGRVEKVHVQLGQHVEAGDVLISLESPEVGNAKLSLYRNRLLKQFAIAKDEWTQEISRNTHSLVESLKQKPTIEKLDTDFHDRKLGRNREQLIAAYSNLRKSRADYERLESLSEQGITAGKLLIAAKTAYDGDLAMFEALLETIDQDEHYNAMLSTHTRQEAESRVAVDEVSLKLFGFEDSDLEQIDPAKEGKELSRYPLKAPFSGTVITKDVALMERVGPDQAVLTVADLSSVWVKADIYEQHLPLLAALNGGTVKVTSAAWPGEVFTAKVFHTGEVVDTASRTIGLRAATENADGRLKPGMFVEVELPGESKAANAIIPTSAIQEHQGEQFVFVQLGDDRFERRDVKLGRREGQQQEVLSGLAASDSVVVQGGFAIKSRMLASSLAGD